jgi:hypothetical protein
MILEESRFMPAAFVSFRAAVSLLPPQRSNGDWESTKTSA